MRLVPSVIAPLLLALVPNLAGAQCAKSASESATHVIELFSSEGCSSCPPAEDWLRRITAEDSHIVGLEFHVDYWDSLGWRDVYASPLYTARQQDLASRRKSSIVYTPEVIVDGDEWRAWQHDGRLPTEKLSRKDRIPLTFEISRDNPPAANLASTSGSTTQSLRWYLAVTESGLERSIRAGENRGAVLHHADVVRSLVGPFQIGGTGRRIDLPPDTDTARLKVVALVVDESEPRTVEAFALPLRRCMP